MTRVVKKIVRFVASVVLFLIGGALFTVAAIVMGDHGMSVLSRVSVICTVLLGQTLIQFAMDD